MVGEKSPLHQNPSFEGWAGDDWCNGLWVLKKSL